MKFVEVQETKDPEATEAMGLPTLDLFAGAGGFTLGAHQAGADVRLSIDIDALACQTLERNTSLLGGEIVKEDISGLDGNALRRMASLRSKDELVIVGGPPCQAVSKAAYWIESGGDARYRRARARGEEAERPSPLTLPRDDERRTLTDHFFRLVLESRARAFIFENVPSILHPRNISWIRAVIKAVENEGYTITLTRSMALDYGVPQKRERVFVLGVKGKVPTVPVPTHSRNLKGVGDLLPMPTAGPALEPYRSARFYEAGEEITGRWAQHLREVPPGGNYKALTAWAGHPRPSFVAETRYWHFLLKLSPDLPSWTIPASPGPWTGPFHWVNRRLRTPELAAIQGFPEEFSFAGARRERVRQIGNAVPPPLARRMVEGLFASLDGTSKQSACVA